MSTSVESRAIAKLSWEAAWERLGNALHPPAGYPESTPEQLRECFSNAQQAMEEIRIAYDIRAELTLTKPGS
ncbi:hypothetical protein J2W35_006836 [Variovorax boronicumulans]|uniref:hypothetical protein n=1 Tax=Variovorax boronicumulans TaxID=436515 RepID=UPI002780D3D0|nr:hypothetical protein [Variovorax boronicumulans]MDQ0086454.1 hypothetical protein [Variovorax boronicumulans]